MESSYTQLRMSVIGEILVMFPFLMKFNRGFRKLFVIFFVLKIIKRYCLESRKSVGIIGKSSMPGIHILSVHVEILTQH